MTDLNAKQDRHDNEIHHYLVIYQFRSKLANIAFEDMIKSNFNGNCIYEYIENAQSFYLSVPLNREKILCKLKNLIFQNKTYFEDSDYLYIINRFFNTEDKKGIILGHEIIKEQDKIWADIIIQHKLELTTN